MQDVLQINPPNKPVDSSNGSTSNYLREETLMGMRELDESTIDFNVVL